MTGVSFLHCVLSIWHYDLMHKQAVNLDFCTQHSGTEIRFLYAVFRTQSDKICFYKNRETV